MLSAFKRFMDKVLHVFKKPVEPIKEDRFTTAVTAAQIGQVMQSALNQKQISFNPQLQHSKKKSQSKNWAKWRV